MNPALQGDYLALEKESPSLWSRFYRTDVNVYATGRKKFAWCTLCHDLDKPPANVTANIKQPESKGITESGDCAKRMGLLVGKTDVLLRHLKHRCSGADSRVRTNADDALREMHVRKKRVGDSQAEVSKAGVQGAKPAATGERAAKSRRLSASSNTVDQYAVGGNRLI
jgi:hypothetical protein